MRMAGLDIPNEATGNAEDRTSQVPEGAAASLEPEHEPESGRFSLATSTLREGTRRLNLKMSFRTQSSPKKVDKDKNAASRFLGEGVSFKAKLIGILEVNEARGDRMCQEALADLKMAIRAAGEHKQRININIAIDGLRLRDEKTGDCLYHHPVHKISFIAQDMSDSRAFGYIFGSPDTGHRFFGIKTDKAASQVVIAMRDLFQVVFELKKKEIEMAKQHIEQHQMKFGGGLCVDSGSTSKNGGATSDQGSGKMRTIQEDTVKENGTYSSSTKPSQQTSEVIADLLDLEFELNSIQQGIHQMERITPSDPFGPSAVKDEAFVDPFGDNFSPHATIFIPVKTVKQQQQQPVAILPPPPSVKDSSRSSQDPFNVPPPARHPTRRATARASLAAAVPASTVSKPTPTPTPTPPVQPATAQQQEKHWFDQETESLFDEGELVTAPLSSSTNIQSFTAAPPVAEQEPQEPSKSPSAVQQTGGQFDVFTELDPLGTGRSKPYVDRKDFFQELKKPSKKVLKDLVTEPPAEATAPLFQATFDSGSTCLSTGESVTSQSFKDVYSAETVPTGTPTDTVSVAATVPPPATKPTAIDVDPFKDTDPFDKTDPFAEDDFSQAGVFPPPIGSNDPFDTGFADFTTFGKSVKSEITSVSDISPSVAPDADIKRLSPLLQSESFHCPLRVSLPPEKGKEVLGDVYIPPHPTSSSTQPSVTQTSPSLSATLTKSKNKSRLHKQTTLAGMVKLPSPKLSQRSSRLIKQMTVDSSGVTTTATTNQTLRLSPTPPMPPTPSCTDRWSPANQGIFESVTIHNRCAITPSPPVISCFSNITEIDNTSRLSGSSTELAEIAPEPPPRPTTNITPIKPPPLPPKRQQVGSVMKPPPRPPHVEDHPHYDYIENYETSSSPTSQDTEEIKSPPIPVPARRPRFGEADHGSIPQRPRRQYAAVPTASRTEPDYFPPFPLLPPPQKKSPASDSSKTSKLQSPAITTIASFLQSTSSLTTTPATDEQQVKTPHVSTTSLDITLSQLTKTGLADLAAMLGVSPGHLSNMTLQDLTKCLSKLSNAPDNNITDVKPENVASKRDKYATLRESVDEEPEFKAEFENNFEVSESSEKLEDVFQEAPFDKYAVFRELIGQDKVAEPINVLPTSTSEDEHKLTETKLPEAKQLETIAETVTEEPSTEKETEDRYAALREISLDSAVTEKEEADTSSEKEESTAEVTKFEEEYDLLSISMQQSENVDSPTLDTNALREPQSIIETTILEEDVSALEAENDQMTDEIIQPVDELPKRVTPPEPEPVITKDDTETTIQEEIPKLVNGVAANEKEDLEKEHPLEKKQQESETIAAEGWAKFDASNFVSDRPVSEVQSEGGISPWSSDGKEFKAQPPPTPDQAEREDRSRRRRMRRPTHWREDDESEEGWEDRRGDDVAWKGRPWRENGWSDGESFYEDAPPYKERVYPEERRGRRRRVSPWKRGQRSSRDVSPWEKEGKEEDDEDNWGGSSKRWQERSMDEEEEEEEYEVSWKARPKHRGSSWDDEKQRRYGSRDVNGLEYEDGWKRRPSPWGGDGDRRSSWESVSWDEDDRFSQREYGERRVRDRDDEYRWRRESEMDSRYPWGRKFMGPDGEYMWHEQPPRRKHRYYRDRSRESPWEDEYSEHGEEESPRYQGRKRTWPKRPSSASETRWTTEKSSPGDYKSRLMEKQQHSLPNAVRPENPEKMGSYGFTERRYREKVGARPRSREGHFGSDQEYEYWPHQERSRRMDREFSYEQRSQTLHTRRPQRYKKTQDRSYSQKSPFDDDFSMQVFEFSTETKSQAFESDASDSAKKKSPILSSHSITSSGIPTPVDVQLRPKDSISAEPEVKPKEVFSSPQDCQESPQEELSKTRASRSSSHRQSPFEDDFTPPETQHHNARLVSSISSDISDHRRSPYEDIKSTCKVQSVAEETESESAINIKNGKSNDDVFLPADNGAETVQTGGEVMFADFDNSTFGDSVSDTIPATKSVMESKRVDRRISGSLWSSEDSSKTEKHHPGMKVRMSSLLRVDSSSSLRKSESINIFARENDPFDDDFFSSDISSTLPRPKSDHVGSRTSEKSGANNASDPFKWTMAFDTFNFDEEK